MKHFGKLLYVGVKELLTIRMLVVFAVVFGLFLQTKILMVVVAPFLTNRANDLDLRRFSNDAGSIIPFLIPIWVVVYFNNGVFRRQLLDGFNRFDLYTKFWIQGVLLWMLFFFLTYGEVAAILLHFKHPFTGFWEAILQDIQYKLPYYGFMFLLMLTIVFHLRNYASIFVFLTYPFLERLVEITELKYLKTDVISKHLPVNIISNYSDYKWVLTYEQLLIFTLTCAFLMALNIYTFFKKEL